MKYEVKAQSSDKVILEIEADDIFSAADQASIHLGVNIMANPKRAIVTFETDDDYFDLYPVDGT